MSSSDNYVLTVENLNLSVKKDGSKRQILKNVNFSIPGRCMTGLAGGSGCGKSLTALSILQMYRNSKDFESSGRFYFGKDDVDLGLLDELSLGKILGNKLSIIFQEAASSLNPVKKCGNQLEEIIRIHNNISGSELRTRAQEILEKVHLTDIERIYNSYPHEISGGQAQRFMIAMGIANRPELIIADEPTSGLDLQLKKDIMELFCQLVQSEGCSIFFISHEIDLIRNYCDQCYIMSDGEIVEQDKTTELFENPRHIYTQKLLEAQKKLDEAVSLKGAEEKKSLFKANNLTINYITGRNLVFSRNQSLKAVDCLNFEIYKGRNLGLAGPSGSGKSTIAKCMAGLINENGGSLEFAGVFNEVSDTERRKKLARYRQLIFQDPYSSLHPGIPVIDAVAEPVIAHGLAYSSKSAKQLAFSILERVGINEKLLKSLPRQLSGGERQRVCIARALTLKPELLILDEAFSKLDGINTVEILNLLLELQDEFAMSYLVISHDIRIIKYLCSDILVLEKGRQKYFGAIDEYLKNDNEFIQL